MTRPLIILGMLLMLAVSAHAAAPATNATEQSQNPSANNLLFILDASGSMWGRVEGTPKIVIAKDVMSRLVAVLPDDAKVGLMAYGHRRKGDCTDIESLVALGPLDRDAMIEHIQGLNAKGKTPITASVKQAIEQLRQTEESASVVLVSDGLESCGGDPCEAVKAAKQSGVDFILHVVGFDLGDADTSQLQCMADAGGGEFFTAVDADDLTAALAQAVAVNPGLVLEVTSNGKPTPARVFVYAAGSKEEVARDTLGNSPEGHGKNPLRVALSSGTYDVKVVPTAIEGGVERTLTDITVPEKGEIKRTVDFSDGAIELMVTANGKPINAFTYVYKAGTNDEAAREHTGGNGRAHYKLTPGDYDIKIRPRGISTPNRRLEGITVTYGETTQKSVDFSAGTVELTVTANGKPLKARTYIQHADSHKEAARDSTNGEGIASYSIPVGEYRIKVRPDGISAPDQYVDNVTVKAGETTEKNLDFGSGSVRITVTANGKPLKARTYIQDAESHKEAARDGTDGEGIASYNIPVGEYRIKVRPDGISAPDQYIDNVTVKAGETTEKSLDFGSGSVRITVTTNGKPLKARTYIQDADNHKEAARDGTDGEGTAHFSIPVGEYRIKVRPDGISAPDQYVDNVTVSAGETTETTLDIPSGTAQITVTTDGDPLKARTYIQHADSHKEVARDSTGGDGIASYVIPVGEYRIKVRPDGIKAEDRYLEDVIVKPGETTELSLNFPSDSDREQN